MLLWMVDQTMFSFLATQHILASVMSGENVFKNVWLGLTPFENFLAEEEEFLGELADGDHLNESIFNRDQVFARLNFRLGAGSFKLVAKKHSNVAWHATILPVIELEFSDLRWDSEMRPRTSTWEFSMSLGSLFVRDKLTQGTLFPYLICPQVQESQASTS